MCRTLGCTLDPACHYCVIYTFKHIINTAFPSHSSKLLLNPSSSLVPSLSYLNSPQDFFYAWTADLCTANLSVKGREREKEWWEERWSEREWERERKGRGTEWERALCKVSLVGYLMLGLSPFTHPSGLFLDVTGCLLGFKWTCTALFSLLYITHRGIQHFRNVFIIDYYYQHDENVC